MVKIKAPLISLNARGTLSKAITFVRRRRQNIAEKKPEILDVKSPNQLYWRPFFLMAIELWHALSADEKLTWESAARPHHLTGYQWFMSQALRPNPGIYLPLLGGTMQGAIAMAGHDITGLPNVTKSIFLPANEGYIAAGIPFNLGYYSAARGGGNLDEPKVYFIMKVPDDFVSFVSLKALWTCVTAVANMRWRLITQYSACAELYSTHIEVLGFGLTATGGVYIKNCQEPANPLTFVNLALGDSIGIYFEREGSHATDTLNSVPYLHGLFFTYVANQLR